MNKVQKVRTSQLCHAPRGARAAMRPRASITVAAGRLYRCSVVRGTVCRSSCFCSRCYRRSRSSPAGCRSWRARDSRADFAHQTAAPSQHTRPNLHHTHTHTHTRPCSASHLGSQHDAARTLLRSGAGGRSHTHTHTHTRTHTQTDPCRYTDAHR